MPNLLDDIFPPKQAAVTSQEPPPLESTNLLDDIFPSKRKVSPTEQPPPEAPPIGSLPSETRIVNEQPAHEPVTPEELNTVLNPPTERELKRQQLQGQMEAERTAQLKQRAGSGDVKTFLDVGDTRGEVVPFWSGALQAYDAVKLYNAANRFKEGRAEPGDQEALIQHYNEAHKPTTIGYEIGNTLKNMVPFALEMATTSGLIPAAKKAGLKTAVGASEKVIELAAEEAVKQSAGTVAKAATKKALGVAAQSAAARPGEIVAKTYEEMTPAFNVEYTEDGQVKYSLNPARTPDPLEAALVGYGDSLVEVATEHMGGAFGKALSKLPGAVKLAALKEGLKARWLRMNPSKTVADFLSTMKTKAAWDGFLPEILEERAGEVLKPALGIEDQYKPYGVAPEDYLTQQGATQALRQAFAEGIAFLIPGAANLAVQKVGAEREAVQRGKRLDQLSAVRGTEARKEEIARKFEQTQKRYATESIVDGIMDAGKEAQKILAPQEEGEQNAQQIPSAASTDVGLFNTQGTQELPGQVPADESSLGVQARGQGVSQQVAPQAPEQVSQEGTALSAKVKEAEAVTETAPTEAQKEAGNYPKGKVSIQGLPISIENPKGSTRTGQNKDGTEWSVTMPATYGYIRGEAGKDGDQLDVYVGENPESARVYVVNQKNAESGKFDEHKVMIGFDSSEQAVDTYTRAFSDGKGIDRIQSVVPMTMDQFKEWIKNGERSKPVTPAALPIEDELDQLTTQVAALSGKPGTAKQIRVLLNRRRELLGQLHRQIRGEIAAKQAPQEAPQAPVEAPSEALQASQTPKPVETPPKTAKVPKAKSQAAPKPKPPPQLKKTTHARFTQALGRTAAFMNRAGVSGIRHVETEAEAGTGIAGTAATIDPKTGQLVLVVPNIEASVKGMREEEAVDWLHRILVHETIHSVAWRTISNEEAEAVWDSLPIGAQRALLNEYSGSNTLAESGMVKSQAGHEYIRTVLEKKFFGSAQEGPAGSSITDKVLDALRKIVTALKNFAGLNSYADQIVTRVETALNSPDPATAVATSEAPPPAALMSKPEQRRQELVASTMLPQHQIDLVNSSAYIQNHAFLTTSAGNFGMLPTEVKAHLEFYRHRMLTTRNARARLTAPPVGTDLQRMIASVTMDPTEQSALYFDAWQNVHQLMEEDIKLGEQIQRVGKELEALQRKGGVAANPIQAFITQSFTDHKAGLIAQRNVLLATGANMTQVTQINRDIKRLDDMRYGTVAWRVAEAVIANPPGTILNFRALGVNPTDGVLLGSIFQNSQHLTGARMAKQSAAPSPEIVALQNLIQALSQARAFMAGVFADPVFRSNHAQAASAVKARAVIDKEHGLTVTWDSPLDPQKQFQVRFDPVLGVAASNMDNLEQLAGEMEQYLMSPDADPTIAAAYRHHLEAIYGAYFHRAYSPDAGKLMPGVLDPFHLMSANGWLATPESQLERIGGINTAIALMRLRNYSQMDNLAKTRFAQLNNRVQLAVVARARAHGIPPVVWIEEVSDPIFASGQEMGSPRLTAGSMVNGRRIAQEDMDAVDAQKRYVDEVVRAVREMNTTQNRFEPLSIRVDGTLPYLRDPQAAGPYIMPRYTRPEAFSYAEDWREIAARIRSREITKHQAMQEWSAMLGGSTANEAYRQLVVGHMRSAVQRPSYAKQHKTPFRLYYQRMVEMIDRNDPAAPRSFDDVVNHIFGAQAGMDPAKQLHPDQIASQIQKEIGQSLSNVDVINEAGGPIGYPDATIHIASSENFLTNPRGDQLLPDTLLTYSTADANSMARVIGNVQQVLGGRFLAAIERVESELSKTVQGWEAKVRDLVKQGVSYSEAHRRMQEQTRTSQRMGNVAVNFEEAEFHLGQVRKAVKLMQLVHGGQRSLEVESVRSWAKLWRGLVPAGLLQAPGIVLRNRANAAVMAAQLDTMFGNAAKLFGFSIPGLRVPATIAKTLYEIGKGAMTMWTPLLNHKFFRETPWGKEMANAIESGKPFFQTWMGSIFNAAFDQAKRYEKLVELGLAGGPPFWESMRTYVSIPGGRIRSDTPTKGQTLLRCLESAAGITYELGLVSLAPRACWSRMADMGANISAGKAADSVVKRIEENARIFGAQRDAAGQPMDRRTLLSPQELTGNKFASSYNAAYMRLKFQRSGINVDQRAIEYYDRVKAARAAGQPTENIRMLTDAEANSLFLGFADDINKGSVASRPMWTTSTELGRNLGMFWGYGFALNDRYKLAYSRFSRESAAKGIGRGAAHVLFWSMVFVTAAFFTEEFLTRPFTWMIYKERRQVPRVFQSETAKEALENALRQSGPFAPMLFNQVTKAVADVSGSPGYQTGIQILPLAFIDSLFTAVKNTADTGNGWDTMEAWTRQYAPNLKIVLNRLPANDGELVYKNTLRALRAATPSEVPTRKFTGEGYRLSSTSDNINHIVNAISRPSPGPDTELAMRERELAIDTLVAEDPTRSREDAAKSIDRTVQNKAPFHAVIGGTPTAEERDLFQRRMTEGELEDLKTVEEGFLAYFAATTKPNKKLPTLEKQPEPFFKKGKGGAAAFKQGLRER